MPILSNPAFGPRTALAYVTGGTLLCVWTLVWYCTRDFEMSHTQWFWVAGFFLSGITFLFLGLTLGPLGRAARQAEMPPAEAVHAEAAIQQTAAEHMPVMVAVAPVTNAPAPPAVPVPAAPVQVSPAS